MPRGKWAITYAYDKKNRTLLPDSKGNVVTFRTKAKAKAVVSNRLSKKTFSAGKIRDPRIVLTKKRGG